MDGRWYVVLLTFVLPTALAGVTVWKFGSNPLALLVIFAVVILGGFYLTTYFSPEESTASA